jgi:hypothetical protein
MSQPSHKPTGRAEPRFDIDYSYGRQGELQIGEFLEWIAKGNGQVEVKRKRYCDLYFYVETHCDKGRTGEYKPSGISVSTAKAWAFVIDDVGVSVVFSAELLHTMLDDPSTRDREEPHGSCPTKGKLINLAALLYREKQRRKQAQAAAPVVAAVPVNPAPVDPVEKPIGFSKVTYDLTDKDINGFR